MSTEKHTDEKLYLTLGYLEPLFSHVREVGKPIAPLLAVLGINEQDLMHSDIRLPDKLVNQLNSAAEQLCADPNVCLHAGRRMGLSNIGIIGHLLLTCTEASQIMALHCRYQTLVGNGALAEYDINGQRVCLRFRRAEGGEPYSRHAYEYSLAGWLSLVGLVAGEALQADLIEFPCERPADTSEQQALFDCELRYLPGGNEMRVHFGRHLLERSIFAGDSSLREPLEAAAKQRLVELQGSYADASNSVRSRIARFVREQLIHGPPNIESAAEHLDASVRTLQRQLDAEDITYKAIVDNARKELCGRYILNPELNLVDVALMLGFSEQSSFQRAFKRWYQLTPGEYRRQRGA